MAKEKSTSRSPSPKERRKRKKRESKWDKGSPSASSAGAINALATPNATKPAATVTTAAMPNAAALVNSTNLPFANLIQQARMPVGLPVLSSGISIVKMPPPVMDRSERLEDLREQLRELNQKKALGFQPKPPEEQSPSPPPVYDEKGSRLNTRQQRFENEIEARRTEIMDELLKHMKFRSPVLSTLRTGLIRKILEKRIFIPYDKHPDYNFAGVIIGPRGVAQKRMEEQSGCSISLRGQGTRKRKDGKYTPGDELPQHVLIRAPTPSALQKGVEVVEKALVPQSEEERRRVMREIAIINGTLRSLPPCTVCGQEGHRPQLCPQRTRYSAGVKCAICGMDTHVAADCPTRRGNGADKNLQEELGRFMAEINGDLGVDPMKTSDSKASGGSIKNGPNQSKFVNGVSSSVSSGNEPGTIAPPSFKPPGAGKRPCMNFKLGICKFGSQCHFAHVQDDKGPQPRLSRSGRAVCQNFEKGMCRFGDRCVFEHEGVGNN
eukprot:CAMPEP_0184496334 /NCGR_PEP_ID=MMETSP0113_2-20130426/33676_1 /TAXON_ID=91329 /ORGANISM="Norrisiella sphaerica, Strain BC52" /LENGTH=492 /DNA_ID=CAMNT_0026882913 /DNA_START=68 /DNA_END=1543 /DNA_ORIENTATION=+